MPIAFQYPVAKRQEALELRAQGLSYRAIARRLGVGKSTVCEWVNDTTEVA